MAAGARLIDSAQQPLDGLTSGREAGGWIVAKRAAHVLDFPGAATASAGLALPVGTVNVAASSEVVEAGGQAQAPARCVTDVSAWTRGESADPRHRLPHSVTGPFEGRGARRWDGEEQLVVLAARERSFGAQGGADAPGEGQALELQLGPYL